MLFLPHRTKLFSDYNEARRNTTFFLNKNLVFIDSMQFMTSSLEKLVKTFQAIISNI